MLNFQSCEKNLLKFWKYTPFEGCSICQIYTKGWAANVVNGWLKFAEEQAAKPAKKDKSLFCKYILVLIYRSC